MVDGRLVTVFVAFWGVASVVGRSEMGWFSLFGAVFTSGVFCSVSTTGSLTGSEATFGELSWTEEWSTPSSGGDRTEFLVGDADSGLFRVVLASTSSEL